jgi:hypothetical protein
MPRERLLAITAEAERGPLRHHLHGLGADGDGVGAILKWLESRVPPGPWLYPEDQMSDAPLRFLAAEITREKLYERLHDELPYRSTVETESWKSLRDGSIRIDQTIYVERDGHKKIVLGEKGRTIKRHRRGGPQGHRRGGGSQGSPVPVRQGARELGRRSRALPRDGAGIPEVRSDRPFDPALAASAIILDRHGMA